MPLRIPRLVSRIPTWGHGLRTLWPVSENQPEPPLPHVESARETAVRSADHPLAHRIFHADVLRRPRKTFLGDGMLSLAYLFPLPAYLVASYNFFVRPTKHRRRKEKLMCKRCGAMIENKLRRGCARISSCIGRFWSMRLFPRSLRTNL
jgi:hypothetical protein